MAEVPIGAVIGLKHHFEGYRSGYNRYESSWKEGYLQEWLQIEGDARGLTGGIPKYEFPLTTTGYHKHDFQKIMLMDLRTWNDDRHSGNLLIRKNTKGHAKKSLIPTDMDRTLSWNTNEMRSSFFETSYGHEPFDQDLLRYIHALDPYLDAEMVRQLGFPEHLARNSYAMTKLIKIGAERGLTPYQIFAIANPKNSQGQPIQSAIETANTLVVQKAAQSKPQLSKEAQESYFWSQLDAEVAKLIPEKEKPPEPILSRVLDFVASWGFIKPRPVMPAPPLDSCKTLGSSYGPCWSAQELTSGVSRYSYEGFYEGNKQHFEVIKVDSNSIGKVKVQDARSLLSKDEQSKGQTKLPLQQIGDRVPNTIAAITGGFFHYNPPQGNYYEWTKGKYTEGDPVGEVVVEHRTVSQNPEKPHWGSLHLAAGKATISDKHKNLITPPKYAIGGVPLLIKNGKAVEFSESNVVKPRFRQGEVPAPGEFTGHILDRHARTAICKNDKGDLLFSVAEGRTDNAEGLNGSELVNLMKTMGCKDALNIDGGGSAGLWAGERPGKLKSHIKECDPRGIRPIASAIVVTNE